MKQKKFLISLILLIMFGCQQDNNQQYLSTGLITGADPGMCICCGGWKIVVDGVTYNFDMLPSSSPIKLQTETFPVAVKLDFQPTTGGCPKWITILRMIKQ